MTNPHRFNFDPELAYVLAEEIAADVAVAMIRAGIPEAYARRVTWEAIEMVHAAARA